MPDQFKYDPFSEETLADPFPFYEKLQDSCPVHLHEELDDVAGEPVDCRVPVVARVGVERLEDEWQHLVALLRDQRDDVLVVP